MLKLLERIERRNDENLSQPKIHADKIRGLYRIGQEMGLPLKIILDRAIQEFFEKYELQNIDGLVNQGPNILPVGSYYNDDRQD